MKGLSILGSTGSIGRNCLRVIEDFGSDFRVAGLAAGNNIGLLAEQIQKFHPAVVSVSKDSFIPPLLHQLRRLPAQRRPKVVSGLDGLIEVATHPESSLIVSAIVGVTGLLPTFEAIQCGKSIALANKEILVVAGELVKEAARRNKVNILPIDSEHNAIHQCLRSGRKKEVHRIILTASGGPFREFSPRQMKTVTPEMALKHPTWNMGNRVTIDSATLMNKGFEVLEAKWLFDLPVDKISVLIHPQSTVHSMVEFVDGSVIAQLGVTDMRHPIQYALTYPERRATREHSLDFSRVQKLEFMQPNLEKFPCLDLAYRAARQMGAQPCTLNASDEVAVDTFLKGKIRFMVIPKIVEKMMDLCNGQSKFSKVHEILEYDGMVRRETQRLIEKDHLTP
jgi:1-deoxy-D-xylulose-5-phosphate reductoisomerase